MKTLEIWNLCNYNNNFMILKDYKGVVTTLVLFFVDVAVISIGHDKIAVNQSSC